MKSRLAIILFWGGLLILNVSVMAQEGITAPSSAAKGINDIDQSGINVGLLGEVNGTFIIHQQTYGLTRLMLYSPSVKFSGGAYVGFNFEPNMGFEVGIRTCGGGQNYHDNYKNASYTKTVQLSYTQIPIMFKYLFGTSKMTYYGKAGVQMGFLNSSTMSISNFHDGVNIVPDSILKYGQKNPNLTSLYESTDFGLRFEFGDDFMVSDNFYINAGVEAYLGLIDINTPALRQDYKFGGNDYPYRYSSNFIIGIQVGCHYILH